MLSAGTYNMAAQVFIQIKAVLLTLVWSGGVSAILYLLIDKTWGMRATPEQEHEGLDIVDHGERAYHF